MLVFESERRDKEFEEKWHISLPEDIPGFLETGSVDELDSLILMIKDRKGNTEDFQIFNTFMQKIAEKINNLEPKAKFDAWYWMCCVYKYKVPETYTEDTLMQEWMDAWENPMSHILACHEEWKTTGGDSHPAWVTGGEFDAEKPLKVTDQQIQEAFTKYGLV